MNNGCVIVANNTVMKDGRLLDYVAMAEVAALGVRKYLKMPVTLLTTDPNARGNFDSIVVIPARQTSRRAMVSGTDTIVYDWDNDHRIDAFDYSPYGKTLMIDADYIVMSGLLGTWITMLDPSNSFITFASAIDVTSRGLYQNRFLPDQSISQVWATAMSWTKEAKPIFEAAKMVRDNYEMYAMLTGMPSAPFRNDVAFSIALHLLEFKTSHMKYFFRLTNLPPDSSIVSNIIKDGMLPSLVLSYPNDNQTMAQSRTLKLWSSDIHVLNKNYAYDPEIRRIVADTINEQVYMA